ncbi:MAG: helix-turn-helix transcriptional regulator [Lachnospiraceae bacterium]|nr:helix-turn-helix transcriptional regulator [Lachnospiraceae bacterium]
MDEKYGWMEIKLNQLLEEKKISKNKLSHRCEMSWSQLNSYCKNEVTRLDSFVLCKLCTVLDCRIEDLLVFHPGEKHDTPE